MLLLIVYFGFVIYFQGHYLFRTTIGVIPCGGKTSQYVQSSNTQLAQDYVLTITDRSGNQFQLKGCDFSYSYEPSGEEDQILKNQNAFAWPISIFQSSEYELSSSADYNQDVLMSKLDELEIFSKDYMVAPENAYIIFTEETYEVVPEVMGTTPIYDEIVAEITYALESQQNELTLSDHCYKNPSITSDSSDLVTATERLDAYLNATIDYAIEGVDEQLTSKQILAMLSIDEQFEVSIDEEELARYVQSLASKYNTYGDVRNFSTSSGDIVLIGGGDYGWVINKAKEAEQILLDLEGGEPVEREPIYEQTAVLSGPDDIGNTYVEIDYTKQHLWFYKEGELITETDLVSGNISRNNGSPDGVFKIVYKERNATLVGENYSSAVDYFMPFAYNVGIHDASWRSNFGGTIYKSSGSHGCINVPPAIAKTLYDNIETGTPVVAYYREPVILTAENARISNAYSYAK